MWEDYFNSQLTEEDKKAIKIKEYVEKKCCCPIDKSDLIEVADETFICSKCGNYFYYDEENNKIEKCIVEKTKNSND